MWIWNCKRCEYVWSQNREVSFQIFEFSNPSFLKLADLESNLSRFDVVCTIKVQTTETWFSSLPMIFIFHSYDRRLGSQQVHSISKSPFNRAPIVSLIKFDSSERSSRETLQLSSCRTLQSVLMQTKPNKKWKSAWYLSLDESLLFNREQFRHVLRQHSAKPRQKTRVKKRNRRRGTWQSRAGRKQSF